MNGVVFVMTDLRVKKEDVRKTKDYNIASNDEWNVGKNEANSSLDASSEDILVEAGEDEDASRGGNLAPMDDFKVPPIATNDECHGDDINENEDHVEEDNDYLVFNIGK